MYPHRASNSFPPGAKSSVTISDKVRDTPSNSTVDANHDLLDYECPHKLPRLIRLVTNNSA